ncbi:MAG: beta-ketoacyl-ACP synthase III [Pseudomonadota bacterium]
MTSASNAQPPTSPGIGTKFVGLGHYAPDRIVPNTDLETELDLDPGWIANRTGIHERRWINADQAVSDLAIAAARMALEEAEQSGFQRRDIALTLLATSTPDHLLPPTAPLVAHQLGLDNSGAVDLTGACAGYLYALGMADSFVRHHRRPVLVIAANTLSQRINPKERASMILFSDAAGATVVSPATAPESGVVSVHYASNGALYDKIQIPAGGSRRPFSNDLKIEDTKMRMQDGPSVFQKAVQMMSATSKAALQEAGWTTADIDHWVPHQANTRIIEATRKALGVPQDKTRITVDAYGNSSAASIPFTLSKLKAQKKLMAGQTLLLSAAGAGLTGGAIAYRL